MLFEPRGQRPRQGKGKEGVLIGVVALIVGGMFCYIFNQMANEPLFNRDQTYGIVIMFALVAAGIVGLRLFLWFSKSDPHQELTRPHIQEQEAERRRALAAESQARRAPAEANIVVKGDNTKELILGAFIKGDLTAWHHLTPSGDWFTLPEGELSKHGVIIGGSGSGKTISLLRIAYVAALKMGYRVHYIDAKGDRGTAALFMALMRAAGKQARMFPRESYNGWQGDGNALLNRLMAVETFTEPYYRAVTKRALTLVCNGQAQPPRSSQEFFSRFDDKLKDQAKLQARELAGVELRYRAFYDAIAGKLDAGWSWEDAEASYILLDGLALKEEAGSLGRYLIEDFAHYAAARKRPGCDLLIIDEYSALSTRGTDAANLVERLRSYDCAVVLSSQSYAGLGEEQDAERILDAANWLLVHRTAAPERLTRRAGTQKRVSSSYGIGGSIQDLDIKGQMRMEEEDNVHPDEARRLETGEAIMIAHGRFARFKAIMPPQPGQADIDQIRAWIDERQAAAPQVQAPAPAAQPQQSKRIDL